MDMGTLISGLLFGFVAVTIITLFSVALGGVVTVFYIAIPTARAWLEGIFYSEEERAHIEAMAEIDRMFERHLKRFRRDTRPVINLKY